MNVDDALVVGEPADGVVHEAEEIAVAGEPPGALDVAGEPGGAAWTDFAEDDSGLVGVGLQRVGELGWVLDEAGNYGEDGVGDGLEGQAVLCAGEPVGVGEAGEDGVREGIAVMGALGLERVDLPGYPVRALARVATLPEPLVRVMLGGRLSRSRGGKAPSLLSDLRTGRTRLEHGALNGPIVAAARSCGLERPSTRR